VTISCDIVSPITNREGETDTQTVRRSNKPPYKDCGGYTERWTDKRIHRQQGDIISLLTKIVGDIQGDGQTNGYTDSKEIS
jgi:hypothetical protein